MMKSERGDTLIEVLIATAILAAAIVGGLAIMSFGYSIANNAIERTQVQATMNSQLSLIRYARDAFARSNGAGTDGGTKLWNRIAPHITADAPSATICDGATPQPGNRWFYIQDDLATVDDTSLVDTGLNPATALAEPGRGLWVEARQSSTPSSVNYVDFYVKACWQGIGDTPEEQSRTVMRLYVP